MKNVTEEEFNQFIATYPIPLENLIGVVDSDNHNILKVVYFPTSDYPFQMTSLFQVASYLFEETKSGKLIKSGFKINS